MAAKFPRGVRPVLDYELNYIFGRTDCLTEHRLIFLGAFLLLFLEAVPRI